MKKIEAQPTTINRNESKATCQYCHLKIKTKNEQSRKSTEILNLKKQIQNFESELKSLKQELDDKKSEL